MATAYDKLSAAFYAWREEESKLWGKPIAELPGEHRMFRYLCAAVDEVLVDEASKDAAVKRRLESERWEERNAIRKKLLGNKKFKQGLCEYVAGFLSSEGYDPSGKW